MYCTYRTSAFQLLDFPSYPQWASAHIRTIKVIDTAKAVSPPPAGHAPDGPAVGSNLEVQLAGMTFKPNVVVSCRPRTRHVIHRQPDKLTFVYVLLL
jgi:hypothetical protein